MELITQQDNFLNPRQKLFLSRIGRNLYEEEFVPVSGLGSGQPFFPFEFKMPFVC